MLPQPCTPSHPTAASRCTAHASRRAVTAQQRSRHHSTIASTTLPLTAPVDATPVAAEHTCTPPAVVPSASPAAPQPCPATTRHRRCACSRPLVRIHCSLPIKGELQFELLLPFVSARAQAQLTGCPRRSRPNDFAFEPKRAEADNEGGPRLHRRQ
uniref:Uncharacterized protein n=1 Tax=Arundo donax TaxID=35708 RepID=A0A0A8Z9L0_ARUDO